MRRKISVLYGSANSGKSSTIKILAGWIKDKRPIIFHDDRRLKKETHLLVDFKKWRIGIVSIDDDGQELLLHLDTFAEVDCNVVICCCRLKESVRKVVNANIRNAFQVTTNSITWVYKERHDDKTEEGAIIKQNVESAIELLKGVGLSEIIPKDYLATSKS